MDAGKICEIALPKGLHQQNGLFHTMVMKSI
jgi:hypothetical protein